MSRSFPFLILMMIAEMGFCQFRDDFSDGDFTANPLWTGDTARFLVTADKILRLSATGPDTVSMATESNVVSDAEWDIWLKMSFNTSANNFMRFYLVSDKADLIHPLNGYFLQAGGSKDSVTLYRQNGSTIEQLITGKLSFTGNSTNILRLRVMHDPGGYWHLFSDPLGTGSYTEEGTCYDETITTGSWTGIFCRFTSSNGSKFWFDDIYAGPVIRDTVAPSVTRISITGSNSIDIQFSEPPDTLSACNRNNYVSKKNGIPETVLVQTDSSIVRIVFNDPFPEIFSDSLFISGISDISGNIMKPEGKIFFRNNPHSYSVIINEIMADPDPPVNLPVSEYLELYNRDSIPVDLTGWSISAGNVRKWIPESVILPHSFIILTKGNFLSQFGNALDIFTSSTMLSNEGTTLVLRDQNGKVIHEVEYSQDWYGNDIKSEGGWSLEMTDPNNPCGCAGNWKASEDPSGGTPGRVNSVAGEMPDTIQPFITGVSISGDSIIELHFSEITDSSSFNGIIWKAGETEASGEPQGPGFRSLKLFPSEKIISGITYGIKAEGRYTDCAGNQNLINDSAIAALPDTVSPGMIVINEFLPDPYSDGSRFIEIFNGSSRIIDMRDMCISSYDTMSHAYEDVKNITNESLLFFPGSYYVITDHPEDIINRYITPGIKSFITVSSLPSFTNDYGEIVLSRKYDGMLIDRVSYVPSMHFPLLSSNEGVSMERVSFGGSSATAENWHSASSSSGYATPGFINSQYYNDDQEDELIIEPQVFSPDNDGHDDIMAISLKQTTVKLTRIIIYDREGNIIRNLPDNSITGTDEMFFWDGTDNNGNKAHSGIYIVYIESVDETGKVSYCKKTVVLAVKL